MTVGQFKRVLGLIILLILTISNINPCFASETLQAKIGLSTNKFYIKEKNTAFLIFINSSLETTKIESIKVLSDSIIILNDIKDFPLLPNQSIEIPVSFSVNKYGTYTDIYILVTIIEKGQSKDYYIKVPSFEVLSFTYNGMPKIFEGPAYILLGLLIGWFPYYRDKRDRLNTRLNIIRENLSKEMEENINTLERTTSSLVINSWQDIYLSEDYFSTKIDDQMKYIKEYYDVVQKYNTEKELRVHKQEILNILTKEAKKYIIEITLPWPIIGKFGKNPFKDTLDSLLKKTT